MIVGLIPMESWRTALTGMVVAGLSSCAIPLATALDQLIVPHFGLGLGVGAVDAALVPMLANLVDAAQLQSLVCKKKHIISPAAPMHWNGVAMS